jgi:PAS domain S-box-containing protein
MTKFRLKNISLSLKITILSIIILSFLSSIFITIQSYKKNIQKEKTYIQKTYLYKNNLIYNAQKNINSFIVSNHISHEKLENLIDIQNQFFQTTDSINNFIKKYSYVTTTIQETKFLEEFKSNFQKFQNIVYEIFNSYRQNETILNDITRLFSEELFSYKKISQTLKNLREENNQNFLEAQYILNKQTNSLSTKIIIIFIIFISIFSFLLFYFFNEEIGKPEQLKPIIKDLAQKSIININDYDKKLQSDEIIKFIEQINNNNIKINFYITQLTNKNYNINFEKTPDNKIFKSIKELSNKLLDAEKLIEKRKIEDQHKEWANKGISLFSEIMRKFSNDLKKLGDEVIKNIVKYLDASVGGIFIIEDQANDPHLQLLAAFAYDRKKYYTKRIELGEGLIGTVASDQSMIYLEEIPDDYIEIEAGLGDAPPNTLLIMPLLTDSGLMGVIEIASFKKFQQYEIDFTETLSRSIASTIETVKINARTVELLKESQKKSNDLAQREKILQETMQEVSKAHEIARRNEIEMRGILSGVDQTLMRAEYAPDGTFLNSNIVHRKVMGYDIEYMKGKNIMEFIPDEEKESFKKLWADVAAGHPYQITVKRKNKQTNADLWLLNQYTPIQDDQGNVIKILYLAIDITEQKQAEEKANQLLKEAKEKEAELTSVLAAVDKTILRAIYTPEGIFIDANDIHTRILGYNKNEMKGKSILEFIQDEQEKENFKEFWKQIQRGEAKELTVKRINKSTGADIWLINQYNPILDENGKVYRILYLAIDITDQKISEERAKKLLEESKNKELELRGIFTAIDQTLLRAEYKPDGTFIDANDEHVSILGYDKQKMIGQNILKFIPEEEKENFKKIWNSVKEGNFEQITVKRKNQTTNEDIWLLNEYTPIFNEFGEVTRILYLAIDITEQKKAEQKANQLLAEAKEKEIELTGVLSGIDRTILRAEYTPEGILLDANDIHTRILGYNIEEMKGKSILEFIESKEEKENFKKFWQEIKKGQAKELTVKRINKSTGQEIWLINQYNPITDENNKLQKILYLAIDITEQKKAEQKTKELLEEAKEKELELASVIEAIDRTALRAEYTPSGILIDANEIHQKILGYKKEDMLSASILDFIEDDLKDDFEKFWQEIKKGQAKTLTVKRKNKSTGQDIWLINYYNPILDENGTVTKILYLAIDITQQKRLEQELIIQEKIMNQNMEELFKEYQKLEEKNLELEKIQENIEKKFDTETDELYKKWLKSFE